MRLSSLSLLIRRQLQEHYRPYLAAMAVLTGFLAFLFLLIHQWRDSFPGAVQEGIFLIGLFLSGGIFTNSLFQELSEPSKAIWLLSIPATQAEKIVATILLSTVAFLGVYLGLYYLVDGLYAMLTFEAQGTEPLDLFKGRFYQSLFYYLLFNSLVVLGSIYFSRHSLIKTLLTLILGFVFLYYINNLMIELMIPGIEVTSSMMLGGFQFVHEGENIYVNQPKQWEVLTDLFVRLALPLLLWTIAWLRLREKEI